VSHDDKCRANTLKTQIFTARVQKTISVYRGQIKNNLNSDMHKGVPTVKTL